MSRHEVFCKDLASFEPRGGSSAHDRQTLCFKRVDETRRQRCFRSNKSQIDGIRLRKLRQSGVIVNRNIDELGQLAYTCITRRTKEFHRYGRRIAKGPHDGVLTSTGADDEYSFHV